MENRTKATKRDETSSLSSFSNSLASLVSNPMAPKNSKNNALRPISTEAGKANGVASTPLTSNPAPVSYPGSSKETLRGIEESFALLRTQVENEYGGLPSAAHTDSQSKQLRANMNNQDKTMHQKISSLKQRVQQDLKDDMTQAIKDQISNAIKTTMKRRITDEVDKQLPAFIPICLEDQLNELRQRSSELKAALYNHRARHENGLLDRCAVDDNLVKLLNEDGQPSKLFPHNVRSFLYYDENDLQPLYDHYNLGKIHPQDRTATLNRFLIFIGVSFQVACPPPPGLPTPTSPVTKPKSISTRG
jgi:hypothetical protein